MNNLRHCGFCKHYTENGRRIIELIDRNDMQDILHVLHSQLLAPDLITLNDQPQPRGSLDEKF